MKHLSEDELIELYYGEDSGEAGTHLRACRHCSAPYAELKKSLDAIGTALVPLRNAEYGDRVWETLRPRLVPYQKRTAGWRGWAYWRSATMALSCALLLAVAFFGGRYWERTTTKKSVATGNSQKAQGVILVVLTDHLDRTERLLVALEHADSADRTENGLLQSEARELLASNRLYRASAINAGDPALAGALDRVQGVLAEIANEPDLTVADIERVRKDMNAGGILFQIRVLLARSPEQRSGPSPAKGAVI